MIVESVSPRCVYFQYQSTRLGNTLHDVPPARKPRLQTALSSWLGVHQLWWRHQRMRRHQQPVRGPRRLREPNRQLQVYVQAWLRARPERWSLWQKVRRRGRMCRLSDLRQRRPLPQLGGLLSVSVPAGQRLQRGRADMSGWRRVSGTKMKAKINTHLNWKHLKFLIFRKRMLEIEKVATFKELIFKENHSKKSFSKTENCPGSLPCHWWRFVKGCSCLISILSVFLAFQEPFWSSHWISVTHLPTYLLQLNFSFSRFYFLDIF